MSTRFRHATVVTFAFPASVVQRLVPRQLTLEARDGLGFVAVALVDMDGLRPSRLPAWAGSDAVFVGYRVFVRAVLEDGRVRRGLKVIRTDVDRIHLLAGTRLLTRYDAGLMAAVWERHGDDQRVRVRSRWRGSDLEVAIRRDRPPSPPERSPFDRWEDAAPFSGPLPWTFAPTGQTDSVVAVKGIRSTWDPRPVTVLSHHIALFEHPPFAGNDPLVAAAFHVADVDYRWRPGDLETVQQGDVR